MLYLTPFASRLCAPQQAAELTGQLRARLEASGLRTVVRDATADPPLHHDSGPSLRHDAHSADGPLAALILTGGTESEVLAWSERSGEPLVIIAHPSHNSLPAALEILARLTQLERRARLFLVRDAVEPDSPLVQWARADRAQRELRGKRLGVIGGPSEWLVASRPEPDALRDRWGVEPVAVTMDELKQDCDGAAAADTAEVLADWRNRATDIVEPTAPHLLEAARIVVGLRSLVRRHQLDACALRCFELLTSRATTGCLAVSQLIDDGVMAGCEGDVPATLTMLWLHTLTGELPFVANPQDVLRRERTLWLAHCTIARGLLSRYRLRSHFESGLGVGLEGVLDHSDATLARIGGVQLDRVTFAEGELLPLSPDPARCRTQLALRLNEGGEGWLDELFTRPLGNHLVLVPGHHAATLREHVSHWPRIRVEP